jgi:ribosomal protein S18 acetylase RimI-like enzyme
MNPPVAVTFRQGIPEPCRFTAAQLYDQAFGAKFQVVVPDQHRRIEILKRGLDLSHGVAALSGDQLVGLAGYHATSGSLTGGVKWRVVVSVLGPVKGAIAFMLFRLLDRHAAPRELLMDGIAVAAEMRGQGVGTGLLDAVAKVARELGLDTVRLDVIDTNPRAKQLYLRNGFEVVRSQKFEFLRWLLGFGAADTMVRRVDSHRQGAPDKA